MAGRDSEARAGHDPSQRQQHCFGFKDRLNGRPTEAASERQQLYATEALQVSRRLFVGLPVSYDTWQRLGVGLPVGLPGGSLSVSRLVTPTSRTQVVLFGGYGPLPVGEGAGALGEGGSLDDVRVLHLVRAECRGPAQGDDKGGPGSSGRARKFLLPG